MTAFLERRKSVASRIRSRADSTKAMLRDASPQIFKEQRHLDEGSAERAYWHYGYLSALQDVLKLMSSEN